MSATKSLQSRHYPNPRESAVWRSFLSKPSERRHEALWTLYQPLVRHVAERFAASENSAVELADLVEAGNVGLLDAIADFSPQAQSSFLRLAVPMIRESIARSVAVHLSRNARHDRRLELADTVLAATQAQEQIRTSDPLAFPRELGMLQLREHLRQFGRKR